jgi:ATP-dependent Clp protease adaptor protein ClpS
MVSFSKRSEEPNREDGGDEKRILVLHNDNVNTFDHVIDVLCEVCEHDAIQAEQCALITHYKGLCHIKTGMVDDLIPIQDKMTKEKLLVTID